MLTFVLNHFVLKKYVAFLICYVLCGAYAFAQTNHVNVFKELSGQPLIDALVMEYKTSVVLDYGRARDTLFSKIDGVQDSLECIYTGMKLYMQPGQDPTEAVYLNGIPNGINTEHTWPQGLGAEGIAQSDMHHLYPSRAKANSDRGNFHFGEIPDNQTQTWYLKSSERNTTPTTGKDLYSEGVRGVNGKFEPRESVKGNIARSIFYFYTMYKAQADAQGPNFFNTMKNDLCSWHYLDPVDDVEWKRNQKIASYQGWKLNPFVLDCSLVSRAYCNNIDQACESLILSDVESIVELDNGRIDLYPNPGWGMVYTTLYMKEFADYEIIFRDITGIVHRKETYYITDAPTLIQHDLMSLKAGYYIIEFKNLSTGRQVFKKYMLQY